MLGMLGGSSLWVPSFAAFGLRLGRGAWLLQVLVCRAGSYRVDSVAWAVLRPRLDARVRVDR